MSCGRNLEGHQEQPLRWSNATAVDETGSQGRVASLETPLARSLRGKGGRPVSGCGGPACDRQGRLSCWQKRCFAWLLQLQLWNFPFWAWHLSFELEACLRSCRWSSRPCELGTARHHEHRCALLHGSAAIWGQTWLSGQAYVTHQGAVWGPESVACAPQRLLRARLVATC